MTDWQPVNWSRSPLSHSVLTIPSTSSRVGRAYATSWAQKRVRPLQGEPLCRLPGARLCNFTNGVLRPWERGDAEGSLLVWAHPDELRLSFGQGYNPVLATAFCSLAVEKVPASVFVREQPVDLELLLSLVFGSVTVGQERHEGWRVPGEHQGCEESEGIGGPETRQDPALRDAPDEEP